MNSKFRILILLPQAGMSALEGEIDHAQRVYQLPQGGCPRMRLGLWRGSLNHD